MLWDKAAFTELCRQRCVCPVCLIQAVFSASYQPVMFIPVLLTPVSCLWHCILCLFIPSRISFTCLAFFFSSSGIYINSPFAFTSSLFSYITSPPSDHFLSFLYNHASASKLTFLPYRTCEPIVPLSSASPLYSIFSIWPQRLVLINCVSTYFWWYPVVSHCIWIQSNVWRPRIVSIKMKLGLGWRKPWEISPLRAVFSGTRITLLFCVFMKSGWTYHSVV